MNNDDWTPTSPLWDYLDKVAVAHTGEPGFKHRAKRPELRVEYMQLGLLLGFLEDVFVATVIGMEELELGTRIEAVRAWNKVIWIQNDLFARRYVVDRDTGEAPVGVKAWQGMGMIWAAFIVGILMGVVSMIGYGMR